MADSSEKTGLPVSSVDDQDENSLTLQDILDEEEALEDDADAVLGGSDDQNCTYTQGYVKRQALYACSTCVSPEAEPAGVCLACSYACHEGHELYELYTKRNFRCDCGNSRFPNNPCHLYKEKDPVNADNKYNQNFTGKYCTCQRPYPDPEFDNDDEMIQCVVCEDWYHGKHLEGESPFENYEMICSACMSKHEFLWTYSNNFLQVKKESNSTSVAVEDSVANGSTSGEIKTETKNATNRKSEEDGVSSSTNGMLKTDSGSGDETVDMVSSSKDCAADSSNVKSEAPDCDSTTGEEMAETESDISSSDVLPKAVDQRAEQAGCSKEEDKNVCKLKVLSTQPMQSQSKCAFWPSNWRSMLCRCTDCLELYQKLGCKYLIDDDDTFNAYLEKGKGRKPESQQQPDLLMSTLQKLDRVGQIEVIQGYNNLKSELTDFLKRFADNKKVVREEDVREFFTGMQARKRQRVSPYVPHFCR